MRCLGIPNTAHFANVTQIEDAVSCKSLPRAHYDCLDFEAFWKLVSISVLSLFVCYSSVGKAEVPEGIRAVAARHRGESTCMELGQQSGSGNNAAHAHSTTCVFFRKSTRTQVETWSTRRPMRI